MLGEPSIVSPIGVPITEGVQTLYVSGSYIGMSAI
jgi:hypothetical protein